MRIRIFATDIADVGELYDDILFDNRPGIVVQCEGDCEPVSFVDFMPGRDCETNPFFRYVVNDNRPGLFGRPVCPVSTMEMNLFPPGFSQFEKNAEYRPARASHFQWPLVCSEPVHLNGLGNTAVRACHNGGIASPWKNPVRLGKMHDFLPVLWHVHP